MIGRGSTINHVVRDGDLHAYVDRVLDPARREQVQAHLVRNSEDAVKVQAYAMQNVAFRALFETSGRDSANLRIAGLTVELESKFRVQRRVRQIFRSAAAFVLLLCAIWTGWNAFDFIRTDGSSNQDYAHRAADGHRLFVADSGEVRNGGAGDQSKVISWLSQRVTGIPSRAPDLTAAGYRLIRARVLASSANPAALLVYEHQSSEHPLTLYIGKRAGLPRSTTAFSQNKNVSVVYWQAGPLAYGLVGRIDRETLLRLAGDVDLQIRAKPPLPKQYVRQPAETKPGMIRAEPVRAEPAVVRPVKTDKRDAVDETKSMPPAAAAPEIPATKPAATGETSQPNKT